MWLDLDPGKVEIGNHSSRVGGCRAHISSRAGGLLKCVEVCLFFLSPSKDRTGVDRLNRYTHLTGPPPRHYFHKIPPPHKEKVNFLWPWWSFSPFNSHFFSFFISPKKGVKSSDICVCNDNRSMIRYPSDLQSTNIRDHILFYVKRHICLRRWISADHFKIRCSECSSTLYVDAIFFSAQGLGVQMKAGRARGCAEAPLIPDMYVIPVVESLN